MFWCVVSLYIFTSFAVFWYLVFLGGGGGGAVNIYNKKIYILLDVLVCSIAVYFYEFCQNTNNK